MRQGVNFDADFSAASATLGGISGLSREMGKDRSIGKIINHAHSIMASQFDFYVDSIAAGRYDTLHHVYEWGPGYRVQPIFGPATRLWRHVLTGRGAKKAASTYFISSRKATPINPILTDPEESKSGKVVKTGVHVFSLKASAMEYGIEMTVRPKFGEWLAFVHNKTNKPIFTKESKTFEAGGGKTEGEFNKLFISWWDSKGQDIFDTQIAPPLINDLVDESKIIASSRALSAHGQNAVSAFEAAEEKARLKLANKIDAYDRAAASRQNFKAAYGGGGGDEE